MILFIKKNTFPTSPTQNDKKTKSSLLNIDICDPKTNSTKHTYKKHFCKMNFPHKNLKRIKPMILLTKFDFSFKILGFNLLSEKSSQQSVMVNTCSKFIINRVFFVQTISV